MLKQFSIWARLGLSELGAAALYLQPFAHSDADHAEAPADVQAAYRFFQDKFFCSFTGTESKASIIKRRKSDDRYFKIKKPSAGSDIYLTPYGAPVVVQHRRILFDAIFATHLQAIAKYEEGENFNLNAFTENLFKLREAMPGRPEMQAHVNRTLPSPAMQLSLPAMQINPGSVVTATLPGETDPQILYLEKNWPAHLNGMRQGACGFADQPVANAIMAETNEEMSIVIVAETRDGQHKLFLPLLQQITENAVISGMPFIEKQTQWHQQCDNSADAVILQIAEQLQIDAAKLEIEVVKFTVKPQSSSNDVRLHITDGAYHTYETVCGIAYIEPAGTGLGFNQGFDISGNIVALVKEYNLDPTSLRILVGDPEGFDRYMAAQTAEEIFCSCIVRSDGILMADTRFTHSLNHLGLMPAALRKLTKRHGLVI